MHIHIDILHSDTELVYVIQRPKRYVAGRRQGRKEGGMAIDDRRTDPPTSARRIKSPVIYCSLFFHPCSILVTHLTLRTHTFSITMSNLQSPEFFELSDPHPQSSSILRAHPASTGTVQSIDRALAVVTGPETEEPTMAQQEKKNLAQTNEEYTEFDPMAEVSSFFFFFVEDI